MKPNFPNVLGQKAIGLQIIWGGGTTPRCPPLVSAIHLMDFCYFRIDCIKAVLSFYFAKII